jgi:serine/threonine protein kinase
MAATLQFLQEYRDRELKVILPQELANQYDVKACLKETQNKQVYLLSAKTDLKKYILKINSNQCKEKLEDEYRLHISLKHIGLVPATLFLKEENESYFIREYVEGITLTELVETSMEGNLSEAKLINLSLQICDILNYLHSQKPPIIHRDIKPDNIIVTKEGNCKLIDFGISRCYNRQQDRDTVVMGTECTAPPEQYGYQQTDARSDIYSIGILMLYMATGSMDIREMDCLFISPEIKKWIKKCTRFSPEERYHSIRQLKSRIVKYQLRTTKRFIVVSLIVLSLLSLLGIWKALWMDSMAPMNDLKTLEANENNSYSKLENSTYSFTSPLIEAAARQFLHKSATDRITYEDLNQITELLICGEQIYQNWNEHFVYGKLQYMKKSEYITSNLYNNRGSITSLEDISHMQNLRTLALYHQKISDLSPLMNMSKLTSLGLGSNEISDISAISHLKDLQLLDLSGNQIMNSDLMELSQLPYLQELDLGDTNVTAFDILKNMEIKRLYLFGNKLSDCEGLEELQELEKLIVSGVGVGITEAGVSNISKLTNLTELRIMGSQTFDLSLLTKLTKLTYLDLCACKTESLDALKGLNLQTLYFDLTMVKDISALTYFPELHTIGIRDIPCTDYTPLQQLSNLQFISCNLNQAQEIKRQLGDPTYNFWTQ